MVHSERHCPLSQASLSIAVIPEITTKTVILSKTACTTATANYGGITVAAVMSIAMSSFQAYCCQTDHPSILEIIGLNLLKAVEQIRS